MTSTSGPTLSSDFGAALIAEAKRRLFDESQPRLIKCLSALTLEQIWWRPNPQSNSAGNIVLHLCGNVRQWIGTGLGGKPDHRQRDTEFAERGPIPVADLIDRLNDTLAEAREVLDALDPTTLLQPRRVQGFTETGLSIIFHVVEHFSYHTGQVAWITKAAANMDLGFYAGKPLNRTD